MSHMDLKNISVTGIACAVPVKREKNRDYIGLVPEEEVEKFIETTGVESKYCISEKQTTSDLCFVAAEKIIKEKNVDRESIDALIFITQTTDYIEPATSHVLHKRSGLKKDCIAFDINLGCSGYVYGLYLAAAMLQTGSVKKVLFLAGDARVPNPNSYVKDKMLFGDAGSATLIERGDSEMKCLFRSKGEGYTAIIKAGGAARNPIKNTDIYFKEVVSQMDGGDVFEFTISEVPRSFKDFFKLFGGEINDYDFCVFHQANLFMLKHIAKKIKLSPEKMAFSMDRYGNTSSASIPISIVDLLDKHDNLPDRLKLITSGFGIGLSWGVVTFDINRADIFPMIITDDYFKEAY